LLYVIYLFLFSHWVHYFLYCCCLFLLFPFVCVYTDLLILVCGHFFFLWWWDQQQIHFFSFLGKKYISIDACTYFTFLYDWLFTHIFTFFLYDLFFFLFFSLFVRRTYAHIVFFFFSMDSLSSVMCFFARDLKEREREQMDRRRFDHYFGINLWKKNFCCMQMVFMEFSQIFLVKMNYDLFSFYVWLIVYVINSE